MDQLAYGLPEACRLLGLGRTTLYAAIKSGELKALKAGRRTLITHQALQQYLGARPDLRTGINSARESHSRSSGGEGCTRSSPRSLMPESAKTYPAMNVSNLAAGRND